MPNLTDPSRWLLAAWLGAMLCAGPGVAAAAPRPAHRLRALAPIALQTRTTLRAPHRGGLRLGARLRLLRQQVVRSGAGRGLRALGQQLTVLKRRVVASRVGRNVAAIGRGVGRVTLAVSARLTQGADWVEHRLPGVWGSAFHRLRLLDPLTAGSFAFQKMKADPIFFATYGTFSLVFSNAVVPLLVGFGVSPVAAAIVRLATGTPLDIAALTWRSHARREDRTQTLRGTIRRLGSQYGEFAEARRVRHRAYLAGQPRGGDLASLAAGLR